MKWIILTLASAFAAAMTGCVSSPLTLSPSVTFSLYNRGGTLSTAAQHQSASNAVSGSARSEAGGALTASGLPKQ